MRGSMPESPETAARQQPKEAKAEGCTVEMADERRCGRPLLCNVSTSADRIPVCLMHSRDPNKDDQAFQKEFEVILKAAGEGDADFTRFVFLVADYRGREFKARCIFRVATFTQEADFLNARFTQWACFNWATFTKKADFHNARFTQGADFYLARFTKEAKFYLATFTQQAAFLKARFTQEADFGGATFTLGADFSGATFTQRAYFREAIFKQEANFIGATFVGEANFTLAKFDESFANFRGAQFGSGVGFRETKFRKDDDEVGAIFSLARFERPEKVVFYQTNLRQVLFHNCDVSRTVFSNVEWRRRENGKYMLFEEVVKLDKGETGALKPTEGSADERNYGLIAELYQQLKKNFDDRRDYWTAGDFHWGEMEMKRLASGRQRVQRRGGLLGRWFGRVLGGRSMTVAARIGCGKRWLHRNVGLVAWYKYASEYGESYKRPFRWLLIILALFTLAYPNAGLRPATEGTPLASGQSSSSEVASPEIHYENFFQYRMAHPKGVWWGTAAFFGHSLMTAVSVMAFQREFEYAPVYPWGWLLRLLQLLLSSTLIALFLLAVRRQFRR